MTPGSRAPVRVPIIRPSMAVKPIDVARLCRFVIAHMLALLPRWATMTRPSALGVCPAGRGRCDRMTGHGSRNAGPRRRQRAGSANSCANRGCVWWNAVSKQATCGAGQQPRGKRTDAVEVVG